MRRRNRDRPGDELTEFSWTVEPGYRWVRARDEDEKEDWNLIARSDVDAPVAVRQYSPLSEYTALYRTFALETEPTKGGILTFAQKYGNLTQKAVYWDLSDGSRDAGLGESISSWCREILTMRPHVNLWDAVQNEDNTYLKDHILWREGKVEFDSDPGAPAERGRKALTFPKVWTIAVSRFMPELYNSLSPDDLGKPACRLLRITTGRKLSDHGVVADLLWSPTNPVFRLRFAPSSLIGAIWLQFAKAIEGSKQYRQCEHCKLWFEVGGSRAARSDKRFCTPTCKAAQHRKKGNG